MNIPTKFGSNWPGGFRKEDKNNRHLWASVFFGGLLPINKQALFRGPSNEHSFQIWFQLIR